MGVGVTFYSLTSKFFYVLGKALSAELSCTETGLIIYLLSFMFSLKRTLENGAYFYMYSSVIKWKLIRVFAYASRQLFFQNCCTEILQKLSGPPFLWRCVLE